MLGLVVVQGFVRHDGGMPYNDLLESLQEVPSSGVREAYLRFVALAGDASLRRDGGPEHITGSCFIFSPEFDQILLCFHGKGQFWVQFGGHVEPQDATVAETAQREAREESGIADLVLLCPSIVDLDRHELHSGFSCSAHWDVGFAAVVDPTARVTVSEESDDVRWFPVDELPHQVPTGFRARLEHARRRAVSMIHSPGDEKDSLDG